MTSTATATRPGLSRLLLAWFAVDVVLVFMSGVQLFLLGDYTDQVFAWTVKPTVSAAFMGAAYWSSLFLVGLSATRKRWVDARIALPAVWVFTAIVFIATLYHRDKFHFSSPILTAVIAAWVWLAVYAVVSFVLPFIYFREARLAGADPLRVDHLPRWLKAVLSVHAVIALVLGTLMFIAPLVLPWPWELTPLTSRTVGAWLIGFGIFVGQMAWEDEWPRVFAGAAAYLAAGLLQLIVVLRYVESFDWNGVPAWLYVIYWISVAAVAATMVARGKGRVRS